MANQNELAVRAESGVPHRNQTITEIKQTKGMIKKVLKEVMITDVHFGIIPGCKKPSLYKPGSEAILSMFRISAEPVVEDLSTPDCIRYRVKVVGRTPDGTVVGYGIGECSTDEEKYRWRASVSDKEFNATPEDMRRIKYFKNGGEVKQVRTVPADLGNTVLKMAKKRAQIDMTLTATGASDVFDQDIEDLPEDWREDHVTSRGKGNGKPSVGMPQAKQETVVDGEVVDKQTGEIQEQPKQAEGDDDPTPISEAQAKKLFALIRKAGLTFDDFCQQMGIGKVRDLPVGSFDHVIRGLERMAAGPDEGGQG